jgi:hypothetical protein
MGLRGAGDHQRGAQRRGGPAEGGVRHEPTSFAELRAGCYDIDERVKDMDANGMRGSLCFPSFPQFCGQLFARTEDKDVALAVRCQRPRKPCWMMCAAASTSAGGRALDPNALSTASSTSAGISASTIDTARIARVVSTRASWSLFSKLR